MNHDKLEQYLDMAQDCLADYMKQDPTDPKIKNQDYLDGFIVGYVMAHKEMAREMLIFNELQQTREPGQQHVKTPSLGERFGASLRFHLL